MKKNQIANWFSASTRMLSKMSLGRSAVVAAAMLIAIPQAAGHPFPPAWGTGTVDETNGPIHFAPVAWPSEPADPASCGPSCGDWKPYTRFQAQINDPRTQDPSNGGTAPQNYVNISSSCTDKASPSIYYYLYKDADPAKDVLMFRWRVEQIANNYATGPSAGNFGATDPWSSALWTVLFDIDGSGYRSLAAHLNGSSGDPSHQVDLLAGIWGNIPTQSIDYINDPSIKLIAHNPTAFTSGSQILNFNNSLTPNTTWPAGSTAKGTVYDYGTTRARVVSSSPCTEYFVDYQIPIRMLDASASGPNAALAGLNGPKITRSTPLSMLFCTANSLNNPFQKDCALNRGWLADANKPAPFGDYISFDQSAPYAQPIVSSVTATAPSSCPGTYALQTKVQDTLYVDLSGAVKTSVKQVQFFYWLDKDGDGTTAGDSGSAWTFAATGTLKAGTLNTWTANWDSSALAKGKYLIGVQAVDDRTLHDDGVADSPVDNRTFSYLTGSTASASAAELAVQGKIYTNAWSFSGTTKTWSQDIVANRGWIGTGAIAGTDQQAAFSAQPDGAGLTPGSSEDWFGNPAVTGVQTALVGLAINACGVAPTITKAVSPSSVATGQAVTYTVTIANATGAAITLSQIDDPLPSGFTYASTTSVTNNGGSVTPTSSPTGGASGTVSWVFGTPLNVANGTSFVLTFQATASSTAGTYNNKASATTSFGSITSSPVAVGVDAARISLSKTPNVYQVSPGGTVIYTLAYSNDSSVAVTSATLSDTLPANVSCTSYTVNGGSSVSCSGTTASISLGTLAAGATGSVALTATVAAGYATTSLLNSATLDVVAPDGTTHVTKTATSTIAVNVPAPAFTLTKTASATQIAENSNVTWTIAYNNYGTGSASSASISDPLPSGFTYVSSSPAASTAPSVGANGTVTWNLGTVAASASGSVQVVAKSSSPFSGATNPASNTATLSWTGGTPVTSTSDVGVTQSGTSCRNFYLESATTNVGTLTGNIVGTATALSGNQNTATSTTPSGATSTIQKFIAASGSPVETEVARFYQDPVSSQLVTFDGSSTLAGQIFYSKGSALGGTANSNLTLYVRFYDYNPATGAETSIGSTSYTDNGAGSAPFSLSSVVPSGSLAKGHRLLLVVSVIMANNKATTLDLQVQSAQSYAQVCAVAPASLILQKTVSASTVNVTGTSRTLTYTLNYSNSSGSTAATTAVLSDPLPTGTTFVSASSSPAATSTTTPSVGANGTVTWNFNSIAASAAGSTSVTVNVPDDLTGTTTISNTGTLSSTETSAITATATTSVIGGGAAGTPALSIAKSANKTLLLAGDTVTYTLTVVNVGTASASSVVVTDDFPEQAYFSYGSCTAGSGSCSQAGGILTWTVGSLAAGASTTLTFTMTVAASGVPTGVTTLNNLATVADSSYCTSAAVSGCTSGTVTVSISGNPNLSVAKTATPNSSLSPGDTVSYSITVSNSGSATATSVLVNDPIPAGMAYKGSITATAGSGSFDAVNNAVVFTVGDLAAAGSATLTFQATVLTPAAGTTAINTTNVASASAGNAPSKTASATAAGTAAPTLTLAKSGPSSVPYPAANLTTAATASTTVAVDSTLNVDVGQTVRINGTNRAVASKTANSLTLDGVVSATSGTGVLPAISYVLSYKNTGAGIAPAVVLTDTLPAGAIFVAASDSGNYAGGIITWSIGSVAPGASGSVTATIVPGSTGSISNSAHITCTGCTAPTDPTADSVVGGLIISKRTTTPLVMAGGTASYVITVQNTLGSAVSGAALSLTDSLPGGFTYASTASLTINGAAATAGTNPVTGDQSPVWSNFSANVGAGQTLVLTINVSVDSNQGPGVFQNAVSATAAAGVAITPFDPLATTAEDVTVPPAGSGVINGHVFLDTGSSSGSWDATDSGYPGIKVSMESTAGICTTTPSDPGCYIAYTDSAGFFSTIVPAGSWVVTSASPGAGITLTVGQNPKTLTVVAGAVSTQDVGYVSSAPNMAISLSGLPNTATVGTAYSGTYTCTNNGAIAASAATTCTITSGLPAGVSVGACTISGGGAWVAGNSVPVGQTVTCSVSGTPTGAGATTVNGSTGATSDSNAADNTASLVITVGAAAPNMSISLAGLPTIATVGAAYSGTFTCTNGNVAAATAGTTCTISSGLPAGISVGACTISGGGAWVAGNSVPLNQTVTCTVAGTPTSAGATTVNGSTGATGDSNAADNTASISLTVSAAAAPGTPDLTLSKSHSGNFSKGQVGATYLLTVTNIGTVATSGVVSVTDTLPAGLSASAIGGSGWSCSLATLSCTRSDALAASSSYPAITLTVNVSITASSPLVNTATVSGGGETNTANNGASDSTTITAASGVLSGSVYIDANNNGSKDSGEVGLPNIRVTLSGTSASGGTDICSARSSCVATTDANGNYAFDAIVPGTYRLVENQNDVLLIVDGAGKPLYSDGKETAGVAGGIVENTYFGGQAAYNMIDGIVINASVLASNGGVIGGYLFGEQVRAVTPLVLKPPIVNGYVWLDRMHNRSRPPANTEGQEGWTVTLSSSTGTTICVATSDASGFYQFDNLHCPGYEASGLPTSASLGGATFSITFAKASNRMPNVATSGGGAGTAGSGQINGLSLRANDEITEQNLPLDPSGIVYNSVTRLPLSGATVSITGPAGFNPATDLVGGASAQTQITGADGLYSFFLQNAYPSGTYTLAVSAPTGYLPAPSVLIPPCTATISILSAPNPALMQGSNAPPAAGITLHNPATCPASTTGFTTAAPFATAQSSTQYYFKLLITNGVSAPTLNNHIPLDPVPAPPSITKAFSAASIVLGTNATLSLTLNNSNASALTLSQALIDTLPAGMTVAAPATIGGTCTAANVTATAGGNAVSYAIGATIPSGGCTITVPVTASVIGCYTNTIAAGALSTNLGSNAAPASASICVALAGLAPTITKSFGATSIVAGTSTTLTLNLGNPNATAITLLQPLTDALPSGMNIASPAIIGGTCATPSVTAVAGGSSVSFASGASIPAGGCTITVPVTASAAGCYTNSIGSGALQTSKGGNAAAASATLCATATPICTGALADVKTAISAPALGKLGTPVNVLISFSNTGSATALAVTYTASISGAVGDVSCAGAICSYDSATGALSISGLPTTLAPGQNFIVTLTYSALANGTVSIASSIATQSCQGANFDPDTAIGGTVFESAVAGIPTLSPAGLAFLMVAVGLLGLMHSRRRR